MLNLKITREQLEHNKVPVLAIVGDEDPLKKGVDAMNGVMGNLKVVIVRGGDHMSTFRSPLFAQTIDSFIAAHSGQAATASTGK